MSINMTPQDMERLSSYLDDRLDSKDKADLEARLQTSAEWANQLEQLRQVRLLLRSAPRRRAPRNFALTLEMAGKPFRRFPQLSIFRFASAFSAVAAVLVFLFGMFGGLLNRTAVIPLAAAPAADKLAMESMPVESQAAPQIIIWNPGGFTNGKGGGGGWYGGGAEDAPTEALALPSEAVEPAPAEILPETAPEVLPAVPQPETMQPTAETGALTVPAEPASPVGGMTDNGPILGVPEGSSPADRATTPDNPIPFSGNPILLGVEIVLILLTILFGSLSLILRRKV